MSTAERLTALVAKMRDKDVCNQLQVQMHGHKEWLRYDPETDTLIDAEGTSLLFSEDAIAALRFGDRGKPVTVRRPATLEVGNFGEPILV